METAEATASKQVVPFTTLLKMVRTNDRATLLDVIWLGLEQGREFQALYGDAAQRLGWSTSNQHYYPHGSRTTHDEQIICEKDEYWNTNVTLGMLVLAAEGEL